MQVSVIEEQSSQCKKRISNKAKRDKLVIDYLPLVKYVAGRIMIRLPSHIEQEDLIESGILGLIEAAERFNEARHVKFKTYAYHRIRGSILDYLRLEDWVPRSVREKDNLIKGTYNSLEQKLKRSPRAEEVADAMGISCSEYDTMLAEINMCSLLYFEDINFGESGDLQANMHEIVEDSKVSEPLNGLVSKEEERVVERAITELLPKERLVITLYYYEGMLLREIAEVMDLSESRVSQLHHRALISIRAKVNNSKTINNSV